MSSHGAKSAEFGEIVRLSASDSHLPHHLRQRLSFLDGMTRAQIVIGRMSFQERISRVKNAAGFAFLKGAAP